MRYYPELLALIGLACSVHLLPTPENGPSTKFRQKRSAWSTSTNYSRSQLRADSEVFLFPEDGPGEKKFIPKFDKRIPECAKGSTICENVDDYPMKYLENILQDAGTEYRAMFGNDLLDDSSIFHRIDPADENPLCPSRAQIMYPRVAKNKEDKWLFVINQEKYVQGIRVEKCQEPEDPPQSCAFSDSFPIGYKAYCKQKVVYRKLIALNEGGKTITDDFQIPSCCACVVESETKGILQSSGSSDKKVSE